MEPVGTPDLLAQALFINAWCVPSPMSLLRMNSIGSALR
jgi:hypothetical protein